MPALITSGLYNCNQLTTLHLPQNMPALIRLGVRNCALLTSIHLPQNAPALTLFSLTDCALLTSIRLPENLPRLTNLDISNCPLFVQIHSLAHLPVPGSSDDLTSEETKSRASLTPHPFPSLRDFPTVRSLTLHGCHPFQLHSLPPRLWDVGELDISDCPLITEIPETLRIRSWLDLAGTALRSLPARLASLELRWHGIPITPRLAFTPESLTVAEILAEPNVELRRVLIERMGYQTFMQLSAANVLDEDQDPGGPRQLLRVSLPEDEDLVALAVHDPSTTRSYLLRVPPDMTSCQQAAAWIAGFDHPEDYQPLIET